MRRLLPLLFAALFVLTVSAVGQNTRYFLRIDPSGTASNVLTVRPGDVVAFTARAYEATSAGAAVEVPITSIVWNVNPASFGSITPQGVLTVAAANTASLRGLVTATATIAGGSAAGITLTGSVAVVIAAHSGSISGYVTDGNGNPIANAAMSAWMSGRPSTNAAGVSFGKVVTDANGYYLFDALAPGDYVVRAFAQGFIAEYYDDASDIGSATAVTVAAQAVTGIDFMLDAGGSIAGTVINNDDNTPIAGATVIVRSRTLRFERGTRTDANGHYMIDGLPSGDYAVFASAYKFIGKYYGVASSTNLPGVVQVTAPTAVTGIDFELTPAPIAPRRYRGTVVSRGGAVMLYGVVEAIRPSDGQVIATSTDAQGNFEFGAWDGAVIRARALGHVGLYAGNTRDWKASSWSGAQEGVTFLLDPVAENGLAAFSGEVRDAGSGAGLRDAWVYGFDAAGSVYFSVTGDDGGFRITDAPNGTLDMLVSQVGYDVQNAAGEVADAHGSGSISAQRSSVTSAGRTASLPGTPMLYQNYPNPFNPTTAVTVALPERMRASLRVYDLLGRQVATVAEGEFAAGSTRFTFDASGLPSGIYLCRMDAGGTVQTRRMVLAR